MPYILKLILFYGVSITIICIGATIGFALADKIGMYAEKKIREDTSED